MNRMKLIGLGVFIVVVVVVGLVLGGAMISAGWHGSGLDTATGVGFNLKQGVALAIFLMGAGAMFNWGQSVND